MRIKMWQDHFSLDNPLQQYLSQWSKTTHSPCIINLLHGLLRHHHDVWWLNPSYCVVDSYAHQNEEFTQYVYVSRWVTSFWQQPPNTTDYAAKKVTRLTTADWPSQNDIFNYRKIQTKKPCLWCVYFPSWRMINKAWCFSDKLNCKAGATDMNVFSGARKKIFSTRAG